MRFKKESTTDLFLSLLLFFSILFVGAFIYYKIEGWTMIDSLYFVVVTVTTIGYGDVVPITQTGKIFTMFFSFFGVAIAIYLLTKIGTSFFKKHVKKIEEEVKKEQKIKGEIKEVLKENIKKARKKK